ncbi:MAG: AmmeMemoRadiSam system radical SAM enzyme [Nitrospinota bacterium]
MRKAMFFHETEGAKVLCELCPRSCLISEGKIGFCGVRKNKDGTLFALTFNKITSIAVDPIEKKPLYHFYPGISTLSVGTFGCNLRCKHCQNWEISHRIANESGDGMHELSPQELVKLAEKRGCGALAWTYNEPGIWIEYILEAAKAAKENGILTVLVTAGLLNPEPLEELLKVVDAYRLDIKGFTDQLYKNLTGSPALGTVLQNGISAYKAGLHIEIITNVIPGWNDSEEQLSGIANWIATKLSRDVPWHLTAYHPANVFSEPPTPVSTLEGAKALGHKEGIKYIYLGNIPGHDSQNTYCHACSRLLISREGFLISENNIKDGRCKYCGYLIEEYRCPEVPFDSNTAQNLRLETT